MDHAAILVKLRDAKLITEDGYTRAIKASHLHPDRPSPLYHVRSLNIITEDELLPVLANSTGIEGFRLSGFSLMPELVDRMGVAMMHKLQAVPIEETSTAGRPAVIVGMVDPGNQDTIDSLRMLFGTSIEPRVVSPYDLDQLILPLGSASRGDDDRAAMHSLDALLSQMGAAATMIDEEVDPVTSVMDEEVDSAPVVQVVDGLIVQAVTQRASDIHIEPMSTGLQIRFRIDGSLQMQTRMPLVYARPITTVVKNKASMNMTDRVRPQDGRFRVRVQTRQIDLRVSSMPSRHGEKTVIRILDHNASRPDIDRLGMERQERERLLDALIGSQGLILVTGPTGSGKTTTLYAVLNKLNQPDVNIVTVEDPVEYEMPGITQVSTNDKAGLSFAEALKAFLRQDPDIIMVGEIRDQETASTAMRAALTGHLVLSTIHTNDAAEALTRLVDLGVERANLAGSARLMMAQRLLRKLCVRCRIQAPPTSEVVAPLLRDYMRQAERAPTESEAKHLLAQMENWFKEHESFFFAPNPDGCAECHKTGYRGRIGVYEVLEVTETIRALIVRGAPAMEIRDAAISEGMRTLREAALSHAASGVTSLQEVLENTI